MYDKLKNQPNNKNLLRQTPNKKLSIKHIQDLNN